MKSPIIPPASPSPPATSNPALNIGQLLPARVITPEEVRQLAFDARETVFQTTVGLVKVANNAVPIPGQPRPAALPEPLPATPQPARPLFPAQQPGNALPNLPVDSLVKLQVIALAPLLRLRVVTEPELRADSGGLPANKPTTPSSGSSPVEFVGELLPRRLLRALLNVPANPLPETSSSSTARAPLTPAARFNQDVARLLLSDASAETAPATTKPATAQSQLFTALREPLRQLLPRQSPTREVLPQLLRLIPRLSLPASGEAAEAPLPKLVNALVREAIAQLPTPRQTSNPDALPRLLGMKPELTASAKPLEEPMAGSENRDAPRALPPAMPASPWPKLAQALKILVQVLEATKLTPSTSAPIIPVASATTAAGPAPLLSRLENLIQALFPDKIQRGPEQTLSETVRGAPELNLPSRPPLASASPVDKEQLELALKLADRVATRGQFLQLQSLQPQTPQPGTLYWQFELPVRDGRRLDVLELIVEEREQAATPSDEEPRRYWSVSLQFDFPGMGPIRSVVHWQQDAVSTRFFAQQPETVALINQELPWLSTALTAHGLNAELHPCEHSNLPPLNDSPPRGLVDIAV